MAKIYVVEADADVRATIVRALEGRGHEVSTARSGRSALSHLESETPDLVVGAVELPDLDGAMISTFVRQSPILQTTPVLLLAADLDEAVRARALRSGASAVLGLPPGEDLVAAVDRLLRGSDGEDAGDETVPAWPEPVATLPPPPSPPPSPADPPTLLGMRRPPPPERQHLAAILDDLVAQMDLRFACILHTSGEVVRAEGAAPWLGGSAAEELVRLALLAAAVSSKVGHGKMGGVVVESTGGTLLLEGLPEQHVLVVGVADASSLGKARYLLRKLRQRLRDQPTTS